MQTHTPIKLKLDTQKGLIEEHLRTKESDKELWSYE